MTLKVAFSESRDILARVKLTTQKSRFSIISVFSKWQHFPSDLSRKFQGQGRNQKRTVSQRRISGYHRTGSDSQGFRKGGLFSYMHIFYRCSKSGKACLLVLE